MKKPKHVYHGSPYKITGTLKPERLSSEAHIHSEDHEHTESAVFATANRAIAGLFMFPEDILASIGFENNIAYICVWGTPEDFANKDKGGYLYVLPGDHFIKKGKDYEWQSPTAVEPDEVQFFPSVMNGIKELGGRVYFINDDTVFDLIQKHKNKRLEILKDVKPY